MTLNKKKFIEELYDIHQNEEIWIIGSGKSLDDFPSDFLEKKVSIGLNGAIYKYPDTTYWHGVHKIWFDYIKENFKEKLKNSITWYFDNKDDKLLESHSLKNDSRLLYWLKLSATSNIIDKKVVETFIEEVKNKKEKVVFFQNGTVAHTAIEIAVLMGAKKITMIGCEHKCFGDWPQYALFDKAYPKLRHSKFNWKNKNLEYIIKGTKIMGEVLGNYNILLQRYFNKDTKYYKKGYEKL